MVSINPPLSSSTQRTKFPQSLMEGLSKKRKFNDHHDDQNGNFLEKSLSKSMPITDLHLDSPLPLEWQRCLDIKSGQIYFYNTRTQKRTSTDPRQQYYQEPKSPPSSSHVISLDLELHLPCSSTTTSPKTNRPFDNTKPGHNDRSTSNTAAGGRQSLRSRSLPSWLAASQGDDNDHQQQQQHQEEEMVAAVCNKCHMLVIMCKISPSCPNCKYMHESSSTTTTNLFKRRSLSLLC